MGDDRELGTITLPPELLVDSAGESLLGLRPGVRFGKIELVQLIRTKGDACEIWLATYQGQSQIVVKFYVKPLDADGEPEFFDREVEIGRVLDHPTLVTAFDHGTHEGCPYICLAHVDGETLGDALSYGACFPPNVVAGHFVNVCSAMEHVHGHELLHLDLKPDNIMLGWDDAVRVIDFGVSRYFREVSGAGHAARVHILGTLRYMSPEQCLGGALDVRSDIFSLGATLYSTLSGFAPFPVDGGPQEIAAEILGEDPLDPRELRPDIPASLADAAMKALAKPQEDRFQTMREFREALTL